MLLLAKSLKQYLNLYSRLQATNQMRRINTAL